MAGVLLDKCVALTKTNMSKYSNEEELDEMKGDIARANVVAILDQTNSNLLAPSSSGLGRHILRLLSLWGC